ncbi:MAG TPA: ribose ABC transporter permease, partial [Acidobacteriota bacterium]|nr:ribose ABC transporter permease [Acidobacteriota bacterium]
MTPKAFLARHGRQFGTLCGLIGLIIIFWILTPHFFTLSNLLNIAQQTSINAIIAVGMTFVIIAAGIDLSVGSIVAFSGVVMASVLHAGIPLFASLLAGLG